MIAEIRVSFPVTINKNASTSLLYYGSTGTYTVDGQTYLEGPKHENLLKRGMNCEIFIEVC
jgi:hypothetical protein